MALPGPQKLPCAPWATTTRLFHFFSAILLTAAEWKGHTPPDNPPVMAGLPSQLPIQIFNYLLVTGDYQHFVLESNDGFCPSLIFVPS